jgi:hypothetical protein
MVVRVAHRAPLIEAYWAPLESQLTPLGRVNLLPLD